MATLTLDQQITAAADLYKSGTVASKPQLAKVKKLIQRKVLSMELNRSLALFNDEVPQCP